MPKFIVHLRWKEYHFDTIEVEAANAEAAASSAESIKIKTSDRDLIALETRFVVNADGEEVLTFTDYE